ncbi:hypothetical protein QT381_02730 [Galbitalea sp. SE-J8]|uniref:hypothetical protein n=1 Tax=Galbitalea sp. SE-J8 TaxID=3054952 RepID=UPI00259D165A|nr:hypothetical protein [Galbitalea sp. SE-J8]MDM4761919.1 hypothetical protein [Galbitalea sp. SE-J8]
MSTRRTGAGQRVGGDHPALHWVSVAGTIAVAMSSFAISFTALLEVAVWQHLPERLRFMTALEVDLPIVVTGAMQIVFKHREQAFPLWVTRVFGWIVTAASAGANFWVTAAASGLVTPEDWIGACFHGFAPVSVYVCTELLGHLITRPKGHATEKRRIALEHKALTAQVRALTRQLRAAQTEAS